MFWDATYRVTTPLFLGGANPDENAELRPSSLKGLLRFWFRAIAHPQLERWEEVKKLEDDIFGSTKKQSSFLLAIRQKEGLAEKKTGENWRNRPGLRYLGYGITDQQGKTLRPYLKENSKFALQIRAKKTAPEDTAFFLPLALQALGLFGAAGARSRKGFGSLSLESLLCDGKETWEMPTTIEKLEERQKALLRKIKLDETDVSLPKYTAFGSQSRVWIANTAADAVELLDAIGIEMLRYRSYGHKNKKTGTHILPDDSEAEQNFAPDHDLMFDFCSGKKIQTHPQRVVFGLPHNYFFLSARENVDIAPANKDYSRRASPLFIHIHALNLELYAAVLTLLPAVFLPKGEKIKISARRQKDVFNTVDVDCNVDYRHISDFMNRPAFNRDRKEIWP